MYNYRAEVLPSKNLQPLPRSHKFHVTTMTEQTKSQILDGKAHDRVLAVSDESHSLPNYGSTRQKGDVLSRHVEDNHTWPPCYVEAELTRAAAVWLRGGRGT